MFMNIPFLLLRLCFASVKNMPTLGGGQNLFMHFGLKRGTIV